MAREILFKAKRIDNGEWVEGNLLVTEEKAYIVIDAETMSMDNENTDLYAIEWYEVDKDTICQYTGLTDKNGRKIWENDVVSTSVGNALVTYVTEKMYNNKFNTGFIVNFADDKSNYNYRHDLVYWNKFDFECGVIGNCFDNPELLGGSRE